MAKKQFKTESKKILDLMINSIYTDKDIFLRELLSNASDALDKLYYRSLVDGDVKIKRESLEINISFDKDKRLLFIEDNGIGMTREELDSNLGTIAKSDSFDFKNSDIMKDNIDVIGQFGVGFYSAFMVSDEITVLSKAFGHDEAYVWKSSGVDGYTIKEGDKPSHGTIITLHIKENKTKEDEDGYNYDQLFDAYCLRDIIRFFSNYIRYPIKMDILKNVGKEDNPKEFEKVIVNETVNDMIPIWKKKSSDCTKEEYDEFYKTTYFDFKPPIKVIHSHFEGTTSSDVLLFIPSCAPYNFYSDQFERGLQLYSSGVKIMDKCSDLIPDYFGFIHGVVDSADFTLNISRETLQRDVQLKSIAKSIERKIKNELLKMLNDSREEYEAFFEEFGVQLKYGVHCDMGKHADFLKDLIIFVSSKSKKPITFKEYIAGMKKSQDVIYYAAGETIDKIDMLPQVDAVKDRGFEILYLTENVDEFALRAIGEYEGKSFVDVCDNKLDIISEQEKNEVDELNKESKKMLDSMKSILGDKVQIVRYTKSLKNHPVCLSTEGDISLRMEKTFSRIPKSNEFFKAQRVLEINANHPICKKLEDLYVYNGDKFKDYTNVLYSLAQLIGGISIDNPTEISSIICSLIS